MAQDDPIKGRSRNVKLVLGRCLRSKLNDILLIYRQSVNALMLRIQLVHCVAGRVTCSGSAQPST